VQALEHLDLLVAVLGEDPQAQYGFRLVAPQKRREHLAYPFGRGYRPSRLLDDQRLALVACKAEPPDPAAVLEPPRERGAGASQPALDGLVEGNFE